MLRVWTWNCVGGGVGFVFVRAVIRGVGDRAALVVRSVEEERQGESTTAKSCCRASVLGAKCLGWTL